MKTTKVRNIGNSLGVILPSSELKGLGISEGAELLLTKSGAALNMRQLTPNLKSTLESMERMDSRHGDVLRGLSDDNYQSQEKKRVFK